MTSKGKRVALYARFSTDMQNPMSVRDQFEQCRRRAKDKGWAIVEEFHDDGQTATSINRTGYNRMFAQLSEDKFDVILVESWDRLVRDQEDGARLYKYADYYGITIHALDRGDMGLLDATLSSLVAAMFLDGLAHKTRRGLRGRVGEGMSAGGLSYGYKVALDANGQKIVGQLEIDESQAEVVRRIMTDYIDGVSPLKIATSLNSEGILSPRSRTGSGGHWKQNAINGNRPRGTGILNNELYIGKRVWNRLNYSKDPTTRKRVSRLNDESEWVVGEVPHLRIISDDLWDAVKKRQDELTKRRDTKQSIVGNRLGQSQAVRRQKYLLSGLLECGLCGGKMTIAGKDPRRRYYCANNKEKGASVCIGMKGLRQTEAEELVLSALKNDLLKDEAYEHFKITYENQLKAQTAEQNERVVAIDQEKRKLEGSLSNLMSAIEVGGHSPTILKRLGEIEVRLQELSRVKRALTVNAVELPHRWRALYRSYVEKLTETLSNEEVVGRAAEQIRELIDRLIVRFDVDSDRHSIEVAGDFVKMLIGANPSEAENYQQSESSLKLVAGVGFEPTTFRL
jgi:site-specific DNA recombinase